MKDARDGLERFLRAQERDYATALAEIRAGRKRSHWMWYIFPQLRGLGHSGMADYYGIEDMDEAKRYLAQPVLRARLEEIGAALLALEGSDPSAVMGWPDDVKLRSCMTLFARADGAPDSVYRRVLGKYYGGVEDAATLRLLGLREG